MKNIFTFCLALAGVLAFASGPFARSASAADGAATPTPPGYGSSDSNHGDGGGTTPNGGSEEVDKPDTTKPNITGLSAEADPKPGEQNEGGSEGGHGQHVPDGGTQGEGGHSTPSDGSRVTLLAWGNGGSDDGGGVNQGGSEQGNGHGNTPGDPDNPSDPDGAGDPGGSDVPTPEKQPSEIRVA